MTALEGPPSLRVGGPAGVECGAAGLVVLSPGGRLGHYAPLSGDPGTLAALLCGDLTPRAALRRVVAALSPRASLVVAGDPACDAEQGVDLLVREDRVAATAQVWRVAAGQVLGVAAVLPPAIAADVEALWLADPDPARLRSRFPVR